MADWRTEAACIGVEPETFFPPPNSHANAAKRVCAGCPVQAECLAEAIRSDARHGVWGGLSEHARGRLPAATRARLAG